MTIYFFRRSGSFPTEFILTDWKGGEWFGKLTINRSPPTVTLSLVSKPRVHYITINGSKGVAYSNRAKILELCSYLSTLQ